MQIPTAALPANLAAPAAPGLTPGTGGSLPTETVYVVVTYVSVYGETTPSPEASAAVTGPNGQVVVASPSALSGATGYNVYAANASGAETLQNTAPVTIGASYTINSLSGNIYPPAVNTSGASWQSYALAQAVALVFTLPTIAPTSYVLAVYNCAGHLLLYMTPDQSGQTFFATARKNYNLLSPISGVTSSTSDQDTASSYAVPESLENLTIGDLMFTLTPYGRVYLAYAQSFGQIAGLS